MEAIANREKKKNEKYVAVWYNMPKPDVLKEGEAIETKSVVPIYMTEEDVRCYRELQRLYAWMKRMPEYEINMQYEAVRERLRRKGIEAVGYSSDSEKEIIKSPTYFEREEKYEEPSIWIKLANWFDKIFLTDKTNL